MNYIIGEIFKDQIVVDTVVDDPCGYVTQFEPIDIINGEQFAWSDTGERSEFLTGTEYDSDVTTGGVLSATEVGVWSNEGPIMQHDGTDDIEALKEALVRYLDASHKKDSSPSYLQYTLPQLMKMARENN